MQTSDGMANSVDVNMEHGTCLTQSRLITLLPSLIAHRWVGRQTQWWPRHKAIYFSWFGPELFCLLLGPPGFNCWFSSAPVFQWCCSNTPGISRCRSQHISVESSSLLHHSIYLWFICFTWWSIDELENSTRTEQLYVLSHDRSWGRGKAPVKPV